MTLRVDVLTRMASLEEISPEVIARISSVIEQRLKSLGGGTREQHGGVRAVAELLNRLDRGLSGPVLEAIEGESPDLAVSIRNLMFVFDDLAKVDDNGIREIIQRADKKVLTIALKGASEEIRARFFENMSKRAGGSDQRRDGSARRHPPARGREGAAGDRRHRTQARGGRPPDDGRGGGRAYVT